MTKTQKTKRQIRDAKWHAMNRQTPKGKKVAKAYKEKAPSYCVRLDRRVSRTVEAMARKNKITPTEMLRAIVETAVVTK